MQHSVDLQQLLMMLVASSFLPTAVMLEFKMPGDHFFFTFCWPADDPSMTGWLFQKRPVRRTNWMTRGQTAQSAVMMLDGPSVEAKLVEGVSHNQHAQARCVMLCLHECRQLKDVARAVVTHTVYRSHRSVIQGRLRNPQFITDITLSRIEITSLCLFLILKQKNCVCQTIRQLYLMLSLPLRYALASLMHPRHPDSSRLS